MELPLNHQLLAVCIFFMTETLSREITEKENDHTEETLCKINTPKDDFKKSVAQSEETIQDLQRGEYRRYLNDNEKFSVLHPIRKSKQIRIYKHPRNSNARISEHSLDLDYQMDDLSHTGSNVQKRRQVKHSRVQRDVDRETEAVEYPYDYENFHLEYFDYIWEKKNDSIMEPSRSHSSKFAKFNPLEKTNIICFPDDWQTGVGAIALYCTLQRVSDKGFTNAEWSRLETAQDDANTRKNLALARLRDGPFLATARPRKCGWTEPLYTYSTHGRLWQIMRFWMIVYLIAGGALWMICGWCCCCLQCKIFNPDDIRREVRGYVISNPPGVIRNTPFGKAMEYIPSQEEKDTHKELEIKAFAFV